MKVHDEVQSLSIFSAGKCNLSCKYCYVPKVDKVMNSIDTRIKKSLTDGSFIKTIKKIIKPENLNNLSFWGGEPTLNLPLISGHLEKILKEFPKLSDLKFSTNISTKKSCETILSFLDNVSDVCEKNKRKMTVDIQFSLDGPTEINDINRGQGITKKVVKNMVDMIPAIRTTRYSSYLKIDFHGKSTFDEHSIKWAIEGDNLYNYYQFFDDLYDSLSQKSGEGINLHLHNMTYTDSGQFITRDGRNLAVLFSMIYGANGYETPDKVKNYKHLKDFTEQLGTRLRRLHYNLLRFYYNEHAREFLNTYTCSAVRSAYGIDVDDYLHICHRSFFYNEDIIDEYRDAAFYNESLYMSNYSRYVKDKWIVNINNKRDVSRYNYLSLLTVKYPTLRFSMIKMLCNELFLSGQIDHDYYLDENNRNLLAGYIAFGSHECIANNIMTHGLSSVEDISIFKLLGNGAHQILLDNLIDTKSAEYKFFQ